MPGVCCAGGGGTCSMCRTGVVVGVVVVVETVGWGLWVATPTGSITTSSVATEAPTVSGSWADSQVGA